MTAVLLVAIGAVLAFIGGLFGASEQVRYAWRAAAGLTVAVVAIGVLHMGPGDLSDPLIARAEQGSAPVSTVLMIENEGAPRQARRLDLAQPIPYGDTALWLMLVLGLAGLIQIRTSTNAQLVAVLPVIGAGLAAWVLFQASGTIGGGEAAIRGYLDSLGGTQAVTSFTVPEGSWSVMAPGLMAVGIAVVVAALAWLSIWVPVMLPSSLMLAAGATLGALACIWRIIEVGGLPWRPAEGALWAAALLLTGAFLHRRAPIRSATLAGFAVALGALATVT